MKPFFPSLVRATIVVGVLSVALLVFLPSTAFAATPGIKHPPHKAGTFIHLASSTQASAAGATGPGCSKSNCNGRNPYITNCAGQPYDSWWVVDSVPMYYKGVNRGWVQLWWSQTCQTNWARYACSSAGCYPPTSLTLYEESSPGCECGWGVRYVTYPNTMTLQEWLPTTRASAEGSWSVGGSVFITAATGWY